MSLGNWIVALAMAALGGVIGWMLGRRSARREVQHAKPAVREVAVRAKADQLVDLGTLSELLDRRDVLVLSTVIAGEGMRAQVVDTAVLDTTGAERLNRLSLPAGSAPGSASGAPGLTPDRLREVDAQPWPAVYAEMVELLAAATLVVGYNAGLHLRMLTQTAERHGLKRLPAADWGCLMRRYTESTAGAGAQWIELADARKREHIATPETHWAVDDARSALKLLRVMAQREEAEREKDR